MEDGITRAVTRSNGTGMEDGITRAVTRERRKRRSRGEVVRGIISIRGLGPCFYLSPFGMCLRGVSLWLTGGDPDPDPDRSRASSFLMKIAAWLKRVELGVFMRDSWGPGG